ncbi:hypothetical protein [Tissierella sp. Yu-01]|uniref:hypothetical protein n=1 Tax=Tissierella sp. Yu-01 TaxID=3035694 RepID=UPI00240D1229|nr:hypothetical protein [Tissierella sp. Yu-01]WFA09222.1 hypothetical protein P3962_01230 [Tissierella sp. Yu-01]
MDKQGIIISHFLEGKSQWEIHRETGFDRKTIKKYVNLYEEKRRALLDLGGNNLILTEEIVTPPKYDSSNRSRIKLTDEIINRIDFFLKENELKKSSYKYQSQIVHFHINIYTRFMLILFPVHFVVYHNGYN